ESDTDVRSTDTDPWESRERTGYEQVCKGVDWRSGPSTLKRLFQSERHSQTMDSCVYVGNKEESTGPGTLLSTGSRIRSAGRLDSRSQRVRGCVDEHSQFCKGIPWQSLRVPSIE